MAEFFGFLALFSLLFFVVYRGYNEYSLEQNIRKDLGLSYDKNTNIFRYYWYNLENSDIDDFVLFKINIRV